MSGEGGESADDCNLPDAILDGPTPYSTIGNTTDGSAHLACEYDGQTYHDGWFVYGATCTGELTASTCNNADYDTDIVVYDGCVGDWACPPGDAQMLGCNDDAGGDCAGFTSEVTVSVTAGNCYTIRVGGWQDGDQGTGVLTLTCEGAAACGDGDCCSANGTPGCDDEDCCNCICNCDPFCCDSNWDELCAGDGFESDCGASNPNSGCANECSECLGGCGDGVCGPDEDCTSCPGDCGPCSGVQACCSPEGYGCADLPPSLCQALEGQPLGPGSECATAECEERGACCLGADCIMGAPESCAASGGEYWGDGTTCADEDVCVVSKGEECNCLPGADCVGSDDKVEITNLKKPDVAIVDKNQRLGRRILSKNEDTKVASVSNIKQAIIAILNEARKEGRKVNVVVDGHGSPGHQYFGKDKMGHEDDEAQTNQQLFELAVAGKIKDLQLMGCETGKGAVGLAFLNKLRIATGAQVVKAWTGDISKQVPPNKFFVIDGEKVDANTVHLDRPPSEPDSDPETPMGDPTGEWHELWPNFCNSWQCNKWKDNGNGFLDECDYLGMKKGEGIQEWYHVENVTVTITVTEKVDPPPPPLYLDYTGANIEDGLFNPSLESWHEVWPQFCQLYNVVDWLDTNGDGRLSASDQILLENKDTGEVREYHIDAVSTDIEIIREDPPLGCGTCPWDTFPVDGVVGAGDLAFLLGNWGPIPPDADPAVVCLDIGPPGPNGNIGPEDLASLLGNWGSCPL